MRLGVSFAETLGVAMYRRNSSVKKVIRDKKRNFGLVQVAQLVGASSCIPKGCGVRSQVRA